MPILTNLLRARHLKKGKIRKSTPNSRAKITVTKIAVSELLISLELIRLEKIAESAESPTPWLLYP